MGWLNVVGVSFKSWYLCLRTISKLVIFSQSVQKKGTSSFSYLPIWDKLHCKSDRWYERTLESYLIHTCVHYSHVLFLMLRNTSSAGSLVSKLHFMLWVVRNGWSPRNQLLMALTFGLPKGKQSCITGWTGDWSPETLQDPTGNEKTPDQNLQLDQEVNARHTKSVSIDCKGIKA